MSAKRTEVSTLDQMLRERGQADLRRELEQALLPIRGLLAAHPVSLGHALSPDGRPLTGHNVLQMIEAALYEKLAENRGTRAVREFLEDHQRIRAELRQLEEGIDE